MESARERSFQRIKHMINRRSFLSRLSIFLGTTAVIQLPQMSAVDAAIKVEKVRLPRYKRDPFWIDGHGLAHFEKFGSDEVVDTDGSK